MRSALHTIICCCMFSSFLALEGNTNTGADATLKRRFAVWLQGRVKRELCHSCERAREADPKPQARREEGPEALALQQSSADRSARSSATKSSGCYLITCAVHDLIFRVHQYNDNTIDPTAPAVKIGSHGYGRRRRSLKDPRASRPTTRRNVPSRRRAHGRTILRPSSLGSQNGQSAVGY